MTSQSVDELYAEVDTQMENMKVYENVRTANIWVVFKTITKHW